MKRFFAWLLALVLILSCTAGYAAELDLSIIRENSGVFTLDVDVERNVAFVETTLSAADRSFTHAHESEKYYSTTKFDILVIDYLDESAAYPVWRLWIDYTADDDYAYCTSVSFYLEGKEYRFSGIADSERYTMLDDTYEEQLLIKFNLDNSDFIVALENMTEDCSYEELEAKTVKMVLHGKEDIEVQLGGGFAKDFAVMKLAFVAMDGVNYMSEYTGTTMKVNDVQ